jgi:hypothetical protein
MGGKAGDGIGGGEEMVGLWERGME